MAVVGPAEAMRAQRFEDAARFLRVFSMGATIAYPLIGLAAADTAPSGGTVVAAVVMGLLFHAYANVGNDVMDLPIDRTDPRRAPSPLVRGRISPQAALCFALALLAPTFLVVAPFGSAPGVPLAGAVGLLAAYNLAGKAIPIPFVADVVQGAGWACLVLAGSRLEGRATAATAVAMLFVAVYVVMVNGIHGAVRDLQNDRAAGARTTALILGARIERGRSLVLPLSLVLSGSLMHTILCGLALAPLARGMLGYGEAELALASAATSIVVALSTGALLRAYFARGELREAMAYGAWHLFLVPAALLASYAWRLAPWGMGVTVVSYLLPPKLFDLAVRGTEFGLPSTRGPTRSPPGQRLGVRLRGYWRMSRAGNPVSAMALTSGGAILGGADLRNAVLAMAASACVVVAANLYNDRCDQPADAVNRPDRPLPAGIVSPNGVDRVVMGMGVSGVLIAVPLGPLATVTSGALLAIGLSYSLLLRRAAFAGPLTVAALFASPVLFGGAFASAGVASSHWIAVGLISVFVSTREILKSIPDRVGDLAAGYRTIATRFGEASALRLFRAGAATYMVATLLPYALGLAGRAYVASALALTVAPTLVAIWQVRGTPSANAIHRALSTTGLVFAGGMAPLVLLG